MISTYKIDFISNTKGKKVLNLIIKGLKIENQTKLKQNKYNARRLELLIYLNYYLR